MPINPPIRSWPGRVCWLVGASTGIGRATAARLQGLGAQVVVSARSAATLDAFVREHPGSRSIALDVTDADALRAAAGSIAAEFGRIDLVSYCAGTYSAMRATQFDLAIALRHVEVNYAGALRLLDAALPRLLEQARAGQGGHLSLVSSLTGYRGLPLALAYGPTKAALINLAETLYLDLAPLGLGVSVVNPGFVDTPLTAGNRFEMPALVSAERAAAEIVSGWEQGRFEIRFPKRMWLGLAALRHLGYRAYFAAVRRATGG
jgi:NAD(P)-dependent dehydrogenase (short-subunit alcohol dehydrogenase family)